MSIRDLVFSIGWRINDRELRNANRRTDEYVGNVQGAERSMSSLANEIASMAQRGERAFSGLEGNSRELDNAINRINDPEISASQAERELQSIREIANRLDIDLRDYVIEIDHSQAQRRLNDVEEQATDLKDILGGLGGAAGGSLVADDLTSFAQVPRELEANLGVTATVAEGLANEVKGVWVDVRDITKGEASQAVETANRVFGVAGERAGELGQKIATLNRSTGEDFHNIGLAARNMVERFPDIKSESQAFDMLFEAQQRLGSEGFSELIDQTQEYGSVLSQTLSGQDFFASMIQGGEMNIQIMDKLGDTLSTELVPRIQEGEQNMMSALTAVAANAQGISGVTNDSLEEFQDLKDEISKLKEEGKEVPQELTSKFAQMKNKMSPAIEVVDDWREGILAGGEDGRKATKELLGAFSELEGTQKKVLGIEIFKSMYEEQGPALEKLFQSISEGTKEFSASIEENKVKNEGFINWFKTKGKEVRSSVSNITESFGAIGESISGSLPFIGAFVGAGGLGKVNPIARVAWTAIKKVGTAGKWVGKTFWNGAKLIGQGISSASRWVGRFATRGGRWLLSIGGKVVGLAKNFGGLALRIGSKVLPLIARFGPKLLKIGGPIGLIAGLVIDLGITIWRNWDKITSATASLKDGFVEHFHNIRVAVTNSINGVIEKVNWMIEKINDIPGVDVPIVPKVEAPQVPNSVAQSQGMSPMAARGVDGSHATGLARVPFDNYLANLHKDEAVLTSTQSKALRDTGILSDESERPKINLSDSPSSYESNAKTKTVNSSQPTLYIENISIEAKEIQDEAALRRMIRRVFGEEFEAAFARLSRIMPRVTEG